MTTPLTTTLAAIRAHGPCEEGWKRLLSHLGKTAADDDQLLMETILDSNGLDDALWCLRALGDEHHGTFRLYAVWCARQVQHLMSDPRSIYAIDVAERHANGVATDAELYAARDAAWAAAWVAARDAAWVAAWDAARDAAWVAARDAARDAAWVAARVAAWDAAWVAARDAQSAKFRQICRAGRFVPDEVSA